MKKILTLLLIILYCINLVSCEYITKGIIIPEKTPEVRTTITKEEWDSALKSGNYSILSNYMLPYIPDGDNFSSGGAEIIKVTDTCCSIDYCSKSGTPFDSSFYEKIDGVLYYIEKTDEGYVATRLDVDETDDYTKTESLATLFLSAFGLDWSAVYNSLVYVEDCKTYRGVIGYNGTITTQIEMECENGNIKRLRVYLPHRDAHEPLNGLFTFYDFGTTVVELPEYTFADE